MKNSTKLLATVAASLMLLAGCFDNDSDSPSGGTNLIDLDDPNPPPTITGSTLYCEDPTAIQYSETASTYEVDGPDSIPAYNVSRETAGRTSDTASEFRASAGNTIKRLGAPVVPMNAGDPDTLDPDVKGSPTPIDPALWEGEPMIHPILVSYTEQVYCDPANLWGDQACYEMGDGSADIGDPNHIDDAFVSLSLDNGVSWKKKRVGDTATIADGEVKSSIQVNWDMDSDGTTELIDYPGHSHKMQMAAAGNNILVAWLDKYCPSGNPYQLEQVDVDGQITYPDDLYSVNGTQGSIDYALPCTVTDETSDEYNCAPNGKPVYEVPFSCVWAARGVFDPETGIIEWRQGEQVTSGARDANKIWIAPAEVGYALSWQEDPEGLRSGKGAGPGAGWSGATGNHGTDIWYTHITMEDFDDVIIDDGGDDDPANDVVSDDPTQIAALETKPKPATKFTLPVRITDNEACFFEGDNKLYCEQVCTDSTTVDSNNNKDQDIVRCLTGDIDPLPQYDADGNLVEDAYAALDGDTGASRPAIKILKTMTPGGDVGEYITVLAYEETKGLLEEELDPGETDIAVEGKVVLAEVFPWNDPVTISAANVVNVQVPRYDPDTQTFDEADMIYENARRVVLVNQVDACEMTANSYPIGFMYKQSFETQGGASDMYLRMFRVNETDGVFELQDEIFNVSGQSSTAADCNAEDATVDSLSWTVDNMDDYPGENPCDNTFSPRAFMRGDEIYTGYAYTPSGIRSDSGNEASNFWIHRYVDDGDGIKWQGPQQVSFEQGGTSALDPRFVPTPPYNAAGVAAGMESDKSNPNVLLMSYGTADADHELDVYYARSTDKGMTFEYVIAGTGEITDDPTLEGARFAKVSAWPLPVEEKEVQLTGSPDGNMGFNVWLQESDESPLDYVGEVPLQRIGLESWLGRVDWTDPATHVVE